MHVTSGSSSNLLYKFEMEIAMKTVTLYEYLSRFFLSTTLVVCRYHIQQQTHDTLVRFYQQTITNYEDLCEQRLFYGRSTKRLRIQGHSMSHLCQQRHYTAGLYISTRLSDST